MRAKSYLSNQFLVGDSILLGCERLVQESEEDRDNDARLERLAENYKKHCPRSVSHGRTAQSSGTYQELRTR